MALLNLPDLSAPVGPAADLHLCLLDETGQVCATNYPVGDSAGVPLPELIRRAYGVAPHPDMPDAIHQRMEHRLTFAAGSAGFYYCQQEDGTPCWISVNFYRTPTGRVVSHFPVSSEKLAQFIPFFGHLKALEGSVPDAPEIPSGDARPEPVKMAFSADINTYRALAVGVMLDDLTRLDAGGNRPQFQKFKTLNAVLETLNDIEASGRHIDAISSRSKLIPYQLKLQAARLESGRGPFRIIASNHQELTQTLLALNTDLQHALSTNIDDLMDAMAYVSQSVQAAILMDPDQTVRFSESADLRRIHAELGLVISDCGQQIENLLGNISKSIHHLEKICNRMRRWISAMETTRMMCKIERAQMSHEADSLTGIEDQLQDVQVNLLKWMGKIETRAEAALDLVDALYESQTTKAA